ncbi:MAG: enoyl-CoA hydratase-related protein [Acidimicrobiales bacterium]
MSTEGFDALGRERRGAVLVITVDRQHRRNALDPETIFALATLLTEATADRGTSVVVLTAAGTESFGSGMDLHALAADRERAGEAVRALNAIMRSPDRVPLVAAVNGSAMAGGFELMMRCDVAVAAEHARFGLPEASRGLLAGGGATLLPCRIPLAVALELGMTGDAIDATRAWQLGLVNHVVPADEVVDRAVALATRIADNAPLAVAAMRRTMWTAAIDGGAAAWEQTQAEQQVVGSSDDAREGIAAFREKRRPRWGGT